MEKIRKLRPFDRNMLIVCEDTNTAPNYLAHLRKKAIALACWDYIEILPKPPLDTAGVISVDNPHKTPRSKRQFQDIQKDEWLTISVESENREQPVIYVRTVQKALEAGFYSEGWAVFDLDGHTGHERAAQMAQQIPFVRIAFSSRSIETWFLLHFGQYQIPFEKVHCKDERGREQNCNALTPCLNDKKGECLLGFLRRNTHLSNYQKKDDLYTTLEPYLRNALDNALWLREKYPINQIYYDSNPYTSMDFLIKSLFKWVSLGDTVTINEFQMIVQQLQPSIQLFMKNSSNRRQILQNQHFIFENADIEFDFQGSGIFEIDESRLVTITPRNPTAHLKLKYPANNERDFIWILC